MVRVQVRAACTAADVERVRALFEEYQAAIGVDLAYQGFADELAGLPRPYVAPDGGLYLAAAGGDSIGCVAFRRLGAEQAEMKRLYVRPGHRGGGVGERLIETVVDAARSAGYRELRLDTLADMRAAQALYLALGFREVAPYSSGYLPGTRFYACHLAG